MSETCIINARKFDGSIHRSWSAELIEETEDLLVFVGRFDREVEHPDLGHISVGTVSHEFYWKKKHFNVFRFHRPDGEFMFFYCNVNLPPTLQASQLDYVDLDIDLLVKTKNNLRILDEDEFERNRSIHNYDDATVSAAHAAIVELKEMISQGSFPFDTLPD